MLQGDPCTQILMRKILLILVVAILVAGGAWYYRASGPDTAAASTTTNAAGSGRGAAAGRGTGGRTPMTVDTAVVTKHEIVDYITVVGNLIGEATVDVAPRVAGRIDSVSVKLGDRVARGAVIAKIEDREIREQINQAQATLEVNKANVTQRQNEVVVQQNTLDRVKASYDRGLTAKQLLEDAES